MPKPPMLWAIVGPDGALLLAEWSDQPYIYLSEEEAQSDLALWQKPGGTCYGRKLDIKVVRYIPVILGEYHG
jgi:hypothetical protein